MSAIPPVGGATGTSTAGSTSAASTASTSMLDRDAFLKLLVAQLRYQDPTKPMDATEMVSQSAQLSVVDKLDEISTRLERAGAIDRLSLAGSIIGKQVAFAGPDGTPVAAVVSVVRFEPDGVVVTAGDWDVPLDAVMAVADAPTTAPATTPSTAPSTAPAA